MLSSFLRVVFTSINGFGFTLENTSCKIELFTEYRYLFSNCCLAYCVMERRTNAQRVLVVKTFHENTECATKTALLTNPTIVFVDKSTHVKVGLVTENDLFCKIVILSKFLQNPFSKSPPPAMISWLKILRNLNFDSANTEIFV